MQSAPGALGALCVLSRHMDCTVEVRLPSRHHLVPRLPVTPVFSLFSPRRIASGLLVCAVLVACDDDPSGTVFDPPIAEAVGNAIISRQGDIRVRITGGIDPTSAGSS